MHVPVEFIGNEGLFAAFAQHVSGASSVQVYLVAGHEIGAMGSRLSPLDDN